MFFSEQENHHQPYDCHVTISWHQIVEGYHPSQLDEMHEYIAGCLSAELDDWCITIITEPDWGDVRPICEIPEIRKWYAQFLRDCPELLARMSTLTQVISMECTATDQLMKGDMVGFIPSPTWLFAYLHCPDQVFIPSYLRLVIRDLINLLDKSEAAWDAYVCKLGFKPSQG